jgi:hypothetical protein
MGRCIVCSAGGTADPGMAEAVLGAALGVPAALRAGAAARVVHLQGVRPGGDMLPTVRRPQDPPEGRGRAGAPAGAGAQAATRRGGRQQGEALGGFDNQVIFKVGLLSICWWYLEPMCVRCSARTLHCTAPGTGRKTRSELAAVGSCMLFAGAGMGPTMGGIKWSYCR